jgi:Ulp1 family protease
LALLTAYALINDVDPLKYITDHIPLNAFEKILHRLLHEYGSDLKSLNNDPGGSIGSIHHQMEMDEYDSELKSLNNETGGSIGSIHHQMEMDEYDSELKSLNNETGGSIGSIHHQMEMDEYDSELKSLNNEPGGSIGSIDHQMEMVIPERANELLEPLSSDQLCRVEDAINKQTALKSLQPGQWLGSDVINLFFENLSKQKKEKSEGKESHFFSTFFWTTMMQIELTDEQKRGTYDYKRVPGWGKKARGGDIFNLDKLFIPIHANRNHWVLAVAFMQTKVIQIYDSLLHEGKKYLENIFQYLQDEHKERKKCPLPDVGKWALIPCQQTTPAQQNG